MSSQGVDSRGSSAVCICCPTCVGTRFEARNVFRIILPHEIQPPDTQVNKLVADCGMNINISKEACHTLGRASVLEPWGKADTIKSHLSSKTLTCTTASRSTQNPNQPHRQPLYFDPSPDVRIELPLSRQGTKAFYIDQHTKPVPAPISHPLMDRPTPLLVLLGRKSDLTT